MRNIRNTKYFPYFCKIFFQTNNIENRHKPNFQIKKNHKLQNDKYYVEKKQQKKQFQAGRVAA